MVGRRGDTMKKHQAVILCDLGYGDAGKGTMVDYLCRREHYEWNVRYTGGPQAAHYVVLPDDQWHLFAHFGSGTFTRGVKTLLAASTFIAPYNLLAEEELLKKKFGVGDALARLSIDSRAAVIMPWHKMLGRMREIARGVERHGSCGQGVGEAVADVDSELALAMRDLAGGKKLFRQLRRIAEMKCAIAMILIGEAEDRDTRWRLEQQFHHFRDAYPVDEVADFYRGFFRRMKTNVCEQEKIIAAALANDDKLIFEGAQGALLDPVCGFPPYVTKTRVTGMYAEAMLAGAGELIGREKIGIVRAYAHRHGVGPLVTEDEALVGKIIDRHNVHNEWQGSFRFGWPDLVAMQYGLAVSGGVDCLAVTCLDQLSGLSQIKVCRGYVFHGDLRRLEELSECCDWQRRGEDEALISALIASPKTVPRQMAELLFDCRPEYTEPLPGWDDDLRGVRSYGELPANARQFIEMIECELGVSVKVVSVGPTYHGKLVRN